jgi:hypothetical protein
MLTLALLQTIGSSARLRAILLAAGIEQLPGS